jgi:hypothetical protein
MYIRILITIRITVWIITTRIAITIRKRGIKKPIIIIIIIIIITIIILIIIY